MTRASTTRLRLASLIVLLLSTAAATAARAEEGEGSEKTVSVSVNMGNEVSARVREVSASGGAGTVGGLVLGGTALLSVGKFALGGGADLSSAANGIASKTLGALAGARLEASPRTRVLLLGELGTRTFSSVPDFFGEKVATPDELSLPYVGLRAGATWLVSSHFDLGVTAFFRRDVGQGQMTISQQGSFLVLPHSTSENTTTVQSVGGTALGLSLQLGFRLETRRPLESI